ncbi:MAG: hypothetical protein ACRDO2_12695 [Nocardioidaceae bacterium]
MTTVADRPTEAGPKNLRSALLSTPELWGAIAIASMWLAVLFASIYGGDFVSTSGGSQSTTTIPTGVFVAFFACLASVAVARRAFRRDAGASGQPGSSGS